MKERTARVRNVCALCFLCLLGLFCLTSILLFVKNHLPRTAADSLPEEQGSARVSLAEEYPFADDRGPEPAAEKEQLNLNPLISYLQLADRFKENTNIYLTEMNPLHQKIDRLQSKLKMIAGEVVFTGSSAFVILPNGYLTECFKYCPSFAAQLNIADLSFWLRERDIPFVHLITPDKSDDSVTAFPRGVPHGYTQQLQEYEAFLKENSIAYLEAKPMLLAQNNNLYSWFYKSDHHWNVRAAYAMARKAAAYLNDELSLPTDQSALDDDRFRLVVYADSFLGSYGRKLGDAWTEDIEVFIPTGETDFSLELPVEGVSKTGRFEDALLEQTLLYSSEWKYAAFLGGDKPLIRIENKTCENSTRVLVIKYSFANALCPYLASTVRYLDIIDPRSFDGSIRTFIEETAPDAVILCMGVVTEYDESALQLK